MDAKPTVSAETLEKTLHSIKKGTVAPCYLLYGEEEYLIQDSLNKIIDLLVPPADRALNLFFMEGGQENIDDLCLALLTAPLFPGRKLVAIKNTTLFQSRKVLPALIQKMRDRLESHPAQVVASFNQFLKLTGWQLADLTDGGWKRITDADWVEKVDGDGGEDRETWLPKVMELCRDQPPEPLPPKDDLSGLSKILTKGIPEGNHLILTAQIVDKRTQLFKQIAAMGKVLYFPRAKGEAKQRSMLLEIAQELLDKKGKRLTSEAWQAMAKKTGLDLRESMLALEKLVAYTGDAPIIEVGDVEEVIGKTKEDTVFDLTSALVERNLQQGLVILKDLFEQGVHHLVIMKMLTREVRLLLYAKLFLMSGRLSSYNARMDFSRFQTNIYPSIKAWRAKEEEGSDPLSGQHPYVIYKTLRNAEGFTCDALIRHLTCLAEMDLSLRSTGRDPKLMLERFFTEVCLT